MTAVRRVVVGVGGGIAAFKSAALVSQLVQLGHDVDVILTHGGEHFVGAATFAALCGRSPVTDTYDDRFPLGAHIELTRNLDLIIVAPATARILASFAHGTADDLLATTYLAADCPVLLAPAMNNTMWKSKAVQRNVSRLQDDGVHFVGPDSGWLSCREVGVGRMSDADAIRLAAEKHLQG